jgi:hypothetical protein
METDLNMGMTLLPIIILLLSIPVTLLLTVLPFWFICKKAGFHGALSLLMLIPIGNIVLVFVLAFADWPALRGQTEGGSEPGPRHYVSSGPRP